jgi:hypothetical protein
MSDDNDEVETEEKVVEIPAAESKPDPDPDAEPDDESEDTEEVISDEPYVEGAYAINIAMVIHPNDGHPNGPRVTIAASSHEKPAPFLISKRMQDLGDQPPWLKESIAKVAANLEHLRLEAEKKKQKDDAEKAAAREKSKKAAAAAQAKKDAPKKARLAKIEKEKQRKLAIKAKAEKQKADAKAKKEKAAAKLKADKEKAALKAKADQQKANAKAQAEEAKKSKAQPIKQPELKPGEAIQPDMFETLLGGKKK